MSPKFLGGLDDDIRRDLAAKIIGLWTHHSTAIEGNSLSLPETEALIAKGLTVRGHPIQEHQEILGHATCIDLIYRLLDRRVRDTDLFDLHKAVQVENVIDIDRPIGGWKVVPNGVRTSREQNPDGFHFFSSPMDVPELMAEFIDALNAIPRTGLTLEEGIQAYTKLHVGFVSVHPFWDGNGRLSRLVSNLPLLNSGHPPLVVDVNRRPDYIDCLAEYQGQTGAPTSQTGVWPKGSDTSGIGGFFSSCYAMTRELIERGCEAQKQRKRNSPGKERAPRDALQPVESGRGDV